MVVIELALVDAVRVREQLNRACAVVLNVAVPLEQHGESVFGDGQRPVVPGSINAFFDLQDA